MKYLLTAIISIVGFAAIALAQSEMPTTQMDADAEPSTAPTTQFSSATTQFSRASTQLSRATTRPSYGTGGNTYRGRFDRRSNNDSGRGATSSAAGTPQPRRISGDFQAVLNRSIFIKGDDVTYDEDTRPRPFNPPTNDVYQPEQSLVFNGVTNADHAVAMVENTDTHEVLRLHVGDQIARGKITAITLNNLDYEVGGRTTRIQFGQTFAGGTPQTIMGALTSPAATGTGTATTHPATNLPPTRQLGESVEDYLRRRRAMGL